MTVLNFFSRLPEADKYFDRIPIYYQDTVIYLDPIRAQTFNYASPISCDNNPQKVIALDLDTVENCVLTFKLVLYVLQCSLKKKQVQSAKNPNSFTAQETGSCSNNELTTFWNRILIMKHSDTQ